MNLGKIMMIVLFTACMIKGITVMHTVEGLSYLNLAIINLIIAYNLRS